MTKCLWNKNASITKQSCIISFALEVVQNVHTFKHNFSTAFQKNLKVFEKVNSVTCELYSSQTPAI